MIGQYTYSDIFAESFLQLAVPRHQREVRYAMGASDHNLLLVCLVSHVGSRPMDYAESSDHGIAKLDSGVGQAHSGPGPFEQRCGKFALQPGDVAANRGLRGSKLLRSPRKTAMPRRALKSDQSARGWNLKAASSSHINRGYLHSRHLQIPAHVNVNVVTCQASHERHVSCATGSQVTWRE